MNTIILTILVAVFGILCFLWGYNVGYDAGLTADWEEGRR